jgi:diaminohydroxyphosphoribosylaminopyrimidine deaminase/5-amino-6-(5-phosphoribosylamino)uracil reductase
MRRALTLARRGWGRTSPNPMVGAVIVKDGEVLGEGWHAEYGAAHAEIAALARASADARGATLYVTLEPCNHVGKTPACAPALVDARLARVVIAANDPNPVARGGTDTLRRSGIAVESGLLADESIELNAAFHARFTQQRPFVTLKLAVSLDGGIATEGTGGVRLTGKAAERAVHMMRAGHDAIAVGSETAVLDDPQLTVRGVRRPRVDPVRVVFDRRARLPLSSKLVRTARKHRTIVISNSESDAIAALRGAGVEIVRADSANAALRALMERGVFSVLCEGGGVLAGALLSEGLVDRLIIFQAPLLLGPRATRAFAFPDGGGAGFMARWRIVEQARLEDDVMTVYAPQR